MRKPTSRTGSFVYGLAGVLVGAMLVTTLPAGGATGDDLVLGVANRSGRSTRLASRGPATLRVTNTAGNVALDLRNGGGAAPLAVDSGVLVENLNADLLDGQDASAFLGATAQATDSDRLDGQDASAFLGATAQATDSDRLDGQHASAFVLASEFRVYGFYNVAAEESVSSGSDKSLTVDCQAGDLAVGGGVDAGASSHYAVITSSTPLPSLDTHPTGWQGGVHNNTGVTVTMRVHVLCADVTP